MVELYNDWTYRVGRTRSQESMVDLSNLLYSYNSNARCLNEDERKLGRLGTTLTLKEFADNPESIQLRDSIKRRRETIQELTIELSKFVVYKKKSLSDPIEFDDNSV